MKPIAHLVCTALSLLAFIVGTARADDAVVPVIQLPVLTAIGFVEAESVLDQKQLEAALAESAKQILHKEIALRDAVRRYIKSHDVTGQLRYIDTPVTWESLAKSGDTEAIGLFVKFLLGTAREIRPFADRINCPQEEQRTICVMRLGIFESEGITSDNLAIEAPSKGALLPQLMHHIAGHFPGKMAVIFRSKMRFDIEKGKMLERLPRAFEPVRYRVFDDVVETGVTSDVLPAKARDQEWIYNQIYMQNYWGAAGLVRHFDTWVSENVVFPSQSELIEEHYKWSFRAIGRLLGERVLITDKSMGHLFKDLDVGFLRQATQTFERFEDLNIRIELELNDVKRSNIQKYLTKTNSGADRWGATVAYFSKIIGAQAVSRETKATLELPLD